MQWLVTGCSTGLGLDIARSVLKAGQNCIATSRNPANTPEAVQEIKERGGVWATLDVSSPSLENDIKKIVQEHGEVDVVINNAGYADGNVFEITDLDAARKLFETNFWGVIRVIQTLMPAMREKKAGTIVNISSSTFWAPPPGAAMYAASKFAMEGMSESLAIELSSFNVRVLTVQPGGMKTAFFDPKKMVLPTIPDCYKGTAVEYAYQMFQSLDQTAAQDPTKTAEAIVKEVLEPSSNPPVLKLPLGKESIGELRKRGGGYTQLADELESIAAACDF